MVRRLRSLSLLLLAATLVAPPARCQKWDGPKPPQSDVFYLAHANVLVPTEVLQATEETHKDTTTASVAGATTPARTPMAEPIFIVQADRLAMDRIELYRLEVKNGRREISFSQRRRKDSNRALHLTVSRLGNQLYKVEVNEPLANGHYALSPQGSNQVFCFEVY